MPPLQSAVDEQLDGLVGWLRENNAQIDHSLAVRSSPEAGRGLFLTRPLTGSERRFLRIPGRLLISSSMASESCGSIRALLDLLPGPSSLQSAALVFFILRESFKGSASDWHHFLSSAPSQFDGPIFWTPERRRTELGYSPVAMLADVLQDELQEIYQDIVIGQACQNWPEQYGKTVSMDQFLWAYGFVESRSFKVSKRSTGIDSENEAATETLLVPFVDMTNHPSHNTARHRCVRKDYDPEADEFFFEWPEPGLGSEGEIFLQYGAYPNWQLLLSYGFAVESNLHDTVELQLDYPGDTAESYDLELRKLLFLEMHPDLVSLRHSVSWNQVVADSCLWRSLRLILANEEELKEVTTHSLDAWLKQPQGVSQRNETLCHETLSRMLRALRGGFETTESGTTSSKAASIYMAAQRSLIDMTLNQLTVN